jgi:hypothetical protein
LAFFLTLQQQALQATGKLLAAAEDPAVQRIGEERERRFLDPLFDETAVGPCLIRPAEFIDDILCPVPHDMT